MQELMRIAFLRKLGTYTNKAGNPYRGSSIFLEHMASTISIQG